jgi:hypothetical protein
MIGDVTLDARDRRRAATFHDALPAKIAARQSKTFDRGNARAPSADQPSLGVLRSGNGRPASVGNGAIVAASVPTRDEVDRQFRKALELGAADERPAGPRAPDFFAAYFRDLDGERPNLFLAG